MKRILLVIVAALFLIPTTAKAQVISYSLTNIEETNINKKERKGYFQQSADIEIGGFTYQIYSRFTANYIAGYRFNDRIFLGGGVGYGILHYYNSTYEGYFGELQIFANTKLYLIKNKRWQPIIDFSTGLINSERSEGFWFFINPQIGVNYKINDKTSIYLSFGGQFLPGYSHSESTCPQLKLGVTF